MWPSKKTLAETLAETKKTLAETKEALAETLVKRAKTLQVDWWTYAHVRTWAQGLSELVEALLVTITYGEVLADSKLKNIIYCIELDHRLRFAHDLWSHRQKYWWLIQIIVPITRLPQELLHQIFLIIIDDASDSPLVLMRVCKLWYTIVTGIWASLKLGMTTPKDTITGKLERNQWFLDVVVDTEIDRGHFTPSKNAYQAIFAAMEAASRWRSLVLETFPASADLPEKLVNRGLRQCTNSVMNRLRTFRIKVPCEMSPLLDHLLRVLGTSASEELTIVEINSANCWRYVCTLTTECRQRCSPVGTVSIRLPAHLQHRDILISCSLLHIRFTCRDLYKSSHRRTRQTQFATALSL